MNPNNITIGTVIERTLRPEDLAPAFLDLADRLEIAVPDRLREETAAIIDGTWYVVVALTLSIPGMVLGETSLSFLGLGPRPPMVSWGVLLQDCMDIKAVSYYPWLMAPVVAIILTVLCFNFVGDGLRDAADPYH